MATDCPQPDTRFFGPATPYATIAALTIPLLTLGMIWGPLGLVVNILLIAVGICLMLFPGPCRQIGTGVTIGYLVFAAAIGTFILVRFIATDGFSAA